jgi:hypothetical protein
VPTQDACELDADQRSFLANTRPAQLLVLSRLPASPSRWQWASNHAGVTCAQDFDRITLPSFPTPKRPCVVLGARYDRRLSEACALGSTRGLLLVDCMYFGAAVGTRLSLYLYHARKQLLARVTVPGGVDYDRWLTIDNAPEGLVLLGLTPSGARAAVFGTSDNYNFASRGEFAGLATSNSLLEQAVVSPTAEDGPCDAATDALFFRGEAEQARASLGSLSPSPQLATALQYVLEGA